MDYLDVNHLQQKLSRSQQQLTQAANNYNQVKQEVLMNAQNQLTVLNPVSRSRSSSQSNPQSQTLAKHNKMLCEHVIQLQLKYQQKKQDGHQMAEIVERLQQQNSILAEDNQILHAKLKLNDELILENQQLKQQLSDLSLKYRSQNNPKIIKSLTTELEDAKALITEQRRQHRKQVKLLGEQIDSQAHPENRTLEVERLMQEVDSLEQRYEMKCKQHDQIQQDYEAVLQRNLELEQKKFE